jgi:hypothetical protein
VSYRSGALCFDVTTGHFEAEVLVDIVGGRGRFAGAAGQFTYHLHSDKAFANGFSAFSGTLDGTIVLPHDE